MKLFYGKKGLTLRLGAMAAAMLFGQQAMAVGTPAGEVVENTASVAYDVATVTQTAVTSNTVSFVVDRRVTFTLTQVGGALVPVSPGQDDAFFDLLLTNTSNSALDFNLVLDQAGVTTVRGVADTADMTDAEYAVSADFVADTDPVQGGPQFVDELPADEDAIIRVWGDAALALLNGQVAGIEISATAATPGGAGLGADLVDTTDDDATVDNVFADADNDGVEVQTDGFIVESADLTVTKDWTIVSGDLGSGLPIPGTILEYSIVVSNAAGATDADNVVISDDIDDDLTFLTGGTGSAYTDISIDDGGGATDCTADAGDANTDGCAFDGTTIVVGNASLPITIAAGGSFTVLFQVQIPDPAVTPPPSP